MAILKEEHKRNIVFLIALLLMAYMAYFWQFPIALKDIRPYLPEFIDDEVERQLMGISKEIRDEIKVPLPEVKYQADFYYERIVSKGEYDATLWVLNNTNRSDKFVADIFSAELIMGMTTRVSTVGGDWANAPDPIGKMTNTTEIYETDDPYIASYFAKVENADYIFLPKRNLYTGWEILEQDINFTKFNDGRYFKEVYSDQSVTIYKVL
jgi:hypothetical protein